MLRKDAAKGGAWHWQQLPGGPMCPLGEKASLGSLGALNVLSDPRGVGFGTGHYLVCLQHWVALGWCQRWGKANRRSLHRSGLPCWQCPPPLRSCRPAHLRAAGAWVAANPRVGRRHSDGNPGGHHRRQHQPRRPC